MAIVLSQKKSGSYQGNVDIFEIVDKELVINAIYPIMDFHTSIRISLIETLKTIDFNY